MEKRWEIQTNENISIHFKNPIGEKNGNLSLLIKIHKQEMNQQAFMIILYILFQCYNYRELGKKDSLSFYGLRNMNQLKQLSKLHTSF